MKLKITRKSSALYPRIRNRYISYFSGSGSHVRFYQLDRRTYDYTGNQMISESKNFVNGFIGNTWTGSSANVIISASSERSGTQAYIQADGVEYWWATQQGLKMTFLSSGESNYAYLSSSYFNTMEIGKKYVFDSRFISNGVTGSNLVTAVSNSIANAYETFTYESGSVSASNSSGSGKMFTNLLDTNGGYLTEYKIEFNFTLISGSYPTMSLVNNNNNSEASITTGNLLAYTGSNNHIMKLNTTTTSSVYLRFMTPNYTEFKIDNLQVKKITNPRVTVKIGDLSKTVKVSSVYTLTWIPIVMNFTASVSSSNKDIQIYTDIPDTIHMIRPVLARGYDYAITTTFTQYDNITGLKIISARGDSNTREAGWALYTNPSNNSIFCRYGDGIYGISVTTPANIYTKNTKTTLSWVLDRTGFATIYINGNPIVSASATDIGASYGFYQSSIGGSTYDNWWIGNIYDFQVSKFDNIYESNFNPMTYLTNKNFIPSGGNAQNVIKMEFDPINKINLIDSFEPVQLDYYNFGSNNIIPE